MSHYERRLDFVCVGPLKTATSWLHKYLLPHSQLMFPQHVKETKFFDRYFDRGLDWYWWHFGSWGEGRLVGEVAPTYFDCPDALERLRRFEGLKIIINVRNPIERTFSLFRHYRGRGFVPDDFRQAVSQMPSIETSGQYAVYCPRWEEAFGGDNCLYVVQEDIAADPQRVIDQVCQFLNVEHLALPEEAKQPFGAATAPSFALAAKIGSLTARTLHAYRLHFLVEFAKRLGLRRLLLGSEAGPAHVDRHVWEHLEWLHQEDIAFLRKRLERPFVHWSKGFTQSSSRKSQPEALPTLRRNGPETH